MKYLKLPWEIIIRVVITIITTIYETFKSNNNNN